MGRYVRFDPAKHKGEQLLIHLSDGLRVADVTFEVAAKVPWLYYVLIEELQELERQSQGSALGPGSKFTPLKPAMTGHTEAFGFDEIWPWAEDRLPVAVEPKYNGFRSIVRKVGDPHPGVGTGLGQVRITFRGEKQHDLPGLEKLQKLSPFIADASVGIDKDGKPMFRPELAVLNSDDVKLGPGEDVKLTFFDVLYFDGKDYHDEPWTERRKALEKFYSKLRDDSHYAISGVKVADSKAKLRSALKWATGEPASEGAVLKDVSSFYTLGGSTSDWSKVKVYVEVKAQVIEAEKNKDGSWGYVAGVLPGKDKEYQPTEFGLVVLGRTMNTKIKASVGDIITVQVDEIVPGDNSLAWVIPRVQDVDKSRKEPYYANQVVDIAKRGGVWQERLREKFVPRETTREEQADELWAKNWHKVIGKGEGRFILHGHFPSLTDEESEWSLLKLLAGNNQYHSDLRLEGAKGSLYGFTAFEGKSSMVGKTGTRMADLKPSRPMRGTFKRGQPKPWLDYARTKPMVSEEAGRVGKDKAKFFTLDYGTYKLTYGREHAFELLLTGKKNVVTGRYMIVYVPIRGGRIWMLTKPADQKTTFPQQNKLERVVKDMRGQKWFFWRASPDEPLEKIDVTKYKEGGK